MVGEPGELVGDRLALHQLVQVDVLDRDRRLARQVREQLALVLRERPFPARHRDQAEDAVPTVRGPQRIGQRTALVQSWRDILLNSPPSSANSS